MAITMSNLDQTEDVTVEPKKAIQPDRNLL